MDSARQCAIDRKEWRALVHITMLVIEFHSVIFAWFLCAFGLRSGGLSLGDKCDTVT